MKFNETLLAIVGIACAAAVIVGGFTACSSMFSNESRYDNTTKQHCVESGQQWIDGNCIAVPGGTGK